MKYKLNQNLDKTIWYKETIERLFHCLEIELAELCTEVKLHDCGTEDLQMERLERIILECADVANFAMFIADVADIKKAKIWREYNE